MKRMTSAVALGAAVLACQASAQTSVQVYGLVDSAIAHVTNADNAGRSVTKIPSATGTLPSRVGFRGTEDLGKGLQAFFVLESGFGLDTGISGQGNRLFGRGANVGLKGAWGTLTVGRQNNMTAYATLKSDVLGPQVFSISSIDLYLPNARSDNAIGYLGNFAGFTVGATYSFGRDGSAAGGAAATNCPGEVPGNAKACRQYTGLLGYETARFGINASYDRLHGNVGAGNGLASSANTDTYKTVNGFVMFGATRIGAGVIDRELHAAAGTTESALYYLGASHPLNGLILDAQLARRDLKHSANDVTLLVARITYPMSKRTAIYASVGRLDNDGSSAVALDLGGTAGAGLAQNGVMTGIRHAF
ncbi:porin [Massilia sp. SYSU DXS3249]